MMQAGDFLCGVLRGVEACNFITTNHTNFNSTSQNSEIRMYVKLYYK
jgi:hypothetical protein